MNKVAIIIVSLILAFTLGLGGCVTVNIPEETPAPSTGEESTPAIPEYHTLSFTLQGNGEYSFPIYLRNDETLHLMWRIENSERGVWFHILTPSGKELGFYDNEGQYADNTLSEGFTRQMQAGATQFSPSDYDWGEGYYTMLVNGYVEPVTVIVEYWIED